MSEEKLIRIGLVGNPNCGKTCIFNELTGARQKVGNWAGVTVEKKEGLITHKGYQIQITDLPGTYSLTAYSPEEIVARNFIIEEKPNLIIDVVDGSNLQRNLYLTTQIAELNVTTIIAMNMWDEVLRQKKEINLKRLTKIFKMPIVKTIGRTGKGVKELLDEIVNLAQKNEKNPEVRVDYEREIEKELDKLENFIKKDKELPQRYNPRWLAIKVLENDSDIEQRLKKGDKTQITHLAEESRKRLRTYYDDDIEGLITEKRYGFINGAYKETVREHPKALERVDYSQRIDKILTHKIFGFPLFLLFMWLLFQTTFTLGAYPMGWIESFVGLISDVFAKILPDGFLQDIIVDGIIDGVGAVLVFLPNILILFLGISFMEDTGYMARAAFIMDKIMHSMGLHGRSFISLLMGFGCNVPAIMAARTLRNPKDRLLTILLNPMMSCSARLPVYVLIAGAFFPKQAGTVVFSMYILGVAMAFVVGKILKKTLFSGDSDPFVMELPPYRIPTFKSTIIHMWERGRQYLVKMGTVVLLASMILWILSSFPQTKSYSQNYDEQIQKITSTYKKKIEKAQSIKTDELLAQKKIDIQKLEQQYQEKLENKPLQDHDDLLVERNRQIIKIESEYAKKLAQTSLDYIIQLKTEKELKINKIEMAKLSEFQGNTFVGKIGHFIEPAIRPLGFNWKMGVALTTGFVAKEVVVSTLGVLYNVGNETTEESEGLRKALKNSDITPLIAYAFMAFVLLYVPCIVTVVTVYKETNSVKWMLFSMSYLTIVAWIVAFIIYQGGKLIGLG